MLSLLENILEFFWDCFPRPVTVKSNERASRFLFGRDFDGTRWERFIRQDFGPGFYIHLPLCEDWDQRVTAAQHEPSAMIPCTTRDGKLWTIVLDVEFEIEDLPTFDICQGDGDEHIGIVAASAAILRASKRTNEQMLSDGPHSFGVHVCSDVQEKLEKRGINIIAVRVTQWQQCFSLHLSGM